MTQLLTEFFTLPLRTFAYGMGLVLQTLQQITELARQQSANTIVTGTRPDPGGTPAAGEPVPVQSPGSTGVPPQAVADDTGYAETRPKEERSMACDTNLSGDDLKIVEYSIVNINPDIKDAQRILFGPATIAFTDDMTGEEFAAWVIALFVQDYPNKVRHDDKKYLRVCYCVHCRFKIEQAETEKEQVEVLKEIRDELARRRVEPRAAAAKSAKRAKKARK